MTTAAHNAEWLRSNLKAGETYAGIIIGQAGESDYRLVLMPPEAVDITWKKAGAWAEKQGGQLPNCRELRLLLVNAAEAFAKEYYWSNEQPAAYSDYAWYQNFSNGIQNYGSTVSQLRARAVRRIPIE
jgi:hypothetical protein